MFDPKHASVLDRTLQNAATVSTPSPVYRFLSAMPTLYTNIYEGWNFNSGNYLFTTDTK